MANTTANSTPLIRAQIYSDYMLELIRDGYLPEGLHRDVADFNDGDTIYIPVMGETILREYAENDPAKYDAIDTGQISMTITEYVQEGTYVTDKLRQDGYKARDLESRIPNEHLRKIKEKWETDLLALANSQTLSDPNTLNDAAHRWVASSGTTVGVMTLEDIAYAKYALDKANIPDEGRIAIVDPSVELAINYQTGLQGFINNPMFEGMVNTGFTKGRKFLRNIYGFDIWVSNRLPRAVSETITGGPDPDADSSGAGGVANIFMSILDDQTKPFMGAMRQMPKMEGERNKDFQRDEYITTARWGFGLQRKESLVVVLTDATKFK